MALTHSIKVNEATYCKHNGNCTDKYIKRRYTGGSQHLKHPLRICLLKETCSQQTTNKKEAYDDA